TLNLITNSSGSTEGTSTGGNLTLNSGGSVININTTSGGAGTLNFGTLTFGVGGTVDLGSNIGTGTNKILFTTAPTLSPVTTGILAKATVNGADFASYDST